MKGKIFQNFKAYLVRFLEKNVVLQLQKMCFIREKGAPETGVWGGGGGGGDGGLQTQNSEQATSHSP